MRRIVLIAVTAALLSGCTAVTYNCNVENSCPTPARNESAT